MCKTCWDDHGRPAIWNPDVQHALDLICVIYTTEPTGGPLHVVLDDWNIDAGTFELYRDSEFDPEAVAAAEELAPLLRRMTVAERASALAYHDGFAEVPEP